MSTLIIVLGVLSYPFVAKQAIWMEKQAMMIIINRHLLCSKQVQKRRQEVCMVCLFSIISSLARTTPTSVENALLQFQTRGSN